MRGYFVLVGFIFFWGVAMLGLYLVGVAAVDDPRRIIK